MPVDDVAKEGVNEAAIWHEFRNRPSETSASIRERIRRLFGPPPKSSETKDAQPKARSETP